MGFAFAPAFKKELLRKLLHLPGLLFLYIASYSPQASAALLGFLIVLYLLSWLLARKKGRGLPFFDFFTRSFERNGSLDWGPVFLALGLGLSLLFFDLRFATFGFLQICLADGAAALAGSSLGKASIFYSPQKTYVGSLAFFITAFLAQLPFCSLGASLLLAAVGTLLESLPLRTWDNLIVPLGVTFFAQVLKP